MRSTVVIYKRGEGYVADVTGKFGGGGSGQRAGLTAEEAAATAARLMMRYAQGNPEGGSLVAPSEVLALVPKHLQNVD